MCQTDVGEVSVEHVFKTSTLQTRRVFVLRGTEFIYIIQLTLKPKKRTNKSLILNCLAHDSLVFHSNWQSGLVFTTLVIWYSLKQEKRIHMHDRN